MDKNGVSLAKCPKCGAEDSICVGKMNPKRIFRCECGHIFAKKPSKKLKTKF